MHHFAIQFFFLYRITVSFKSHVLVRYHCNLRNVILAFGSYFAKRNLSIFGEMFSDSVLPICKLCIFFFTEIDRLNKSLTVSQRSKFCLEEEMKNLKLLSDAALLRSQQIETSKQQEVNLQARCHEFQKEVLGKKSYFLVINDWI